MSTHTGRSTSVWKRAFVQVFGWCGTSGQLRQYNEQLDYDMNRPPDEEELLMKKALDAQKMDLKDLEDDIKSLESKRRDYYEFLRPPEDEYTEEYSEDEKLRFTEQIMQLDAMINRKNTEAQRMRLERDGVLEAKREANKTSYRDVMAYFLEGWNNKIGNNKSQERLRTGLVETGTTIRNQTLVAESDIPEYQTARGLDGETYSNVSARPDVKARLQQIQQEQQRAAEAARKRKDAIQNGPKKEYMSEQPRAEVKAPVNIPLTALGKTRPTNEQIARSVGSMHPSRQADIVSSLTVG
jgi:hypothetical protein